MRGSSCGSISAPMSPNLRGQVISISHNDGRSHSSSKQGKTQEVEPGRNELVVYAWGNRLSSSAPTKCNPSRILSVTKSSRTMSGAYVGPSTGLGPGVCESRITDVRS